MRWVPWLLMAIVTGLAVAALYVAAREARRTYSRLDQVAPLTRLGKLEIEIAELRELFGELLDSHKKLRAREAKRANAADKSAGNGEIPDWRTDPTAARRALEIKHGLPSID